VSRYTTRKRGLLKSHGLSETPIVWRNTSDTSTPRLLRYYYELSSCHSFTVNQFVLREKVMAGAVPVLADNPCATVLVLVSLYYAGGTVNVHLRLRLGINFAPGSGTQ